MKRNINKKNILNKVITLTIVLLMFLSLVLVKNNAKIDKKYSSTGNSRESLLIEQISSGPNSDTNYLSTLNKNDYKQNVFVWGENKKGNFGKRAGYDDGSDHPLIITNGGYFIPDEWRFVDLETDSGTTLALFKNYETNKSHLYAFGSNSHGQLGFGGKDENNHATPELITFFNDKDVEQFYVGDESAGAVTKDSDGIKHLYSWGKNDKGQLGLGNTTEYNSPHELTTLSKNSEVKKITGAYSSTYAIINDGKKDKLYAWGANENGQLGLGDGFDADHYETPQENKLVIEDTIKDISVGNQFAILNTTDAINDHIYSWGKNDKGQLGLGDEFKDPYYKSPEEIELIPIGKRVSKISAGSAFSSATVTDDSEIKQLYTWGDNQYGQLGLGDSLDHHNTPQKVRFQPGLSVEDVSMGYSTTSIILTNQYESCAYTTGHNDKGQLGTWTDRTADSQNFININSIQELNRIKVKNLSPTSAVVSVDVRLMGFGRAYKNYPYILNVYDGNELLGISTKLSPLDDGIPGNYQKIYLPNLKRNHTYENCRVKVNGSLYQSLESAPFTIKNYSKNFSIYIYAYVLLGLLFIIFIILFLVARTRRKRKRYLSKIAYQNKSKKVAPEESNKKKNKKKKGNELISDNSSKKNKPEKISRKDKKQNKKQGKIDKKQEKQNNKRNKKLSKMNK